MPQGPSQGPSQQQPQRPVVRMPPLRVRPRTAPQAEQPELPSQMPQAEAMPPQAEIEPDEDAVVGLQPEYKPLPFAPEELVVPAVPVDFLPAYETPAEQEAWSEEDLVEAPIPIRKDYMRPEPSAEPQPYVPEPRFRTITVRDGESAQVTAMLPYRRIVTVLTIGDAARVTFAFRSAYQGESMLVVVAGEPPVDLPVFPDQELFVLQQTGVDQEMSFQIEPRGTGR